MKRPIGFTTKQIEQQKPASKQDVDAVSKTAWRTQGEVNVLIDLFIVLFETLDASQQRVIHAYLLRLSNGVQRTTPANDVGKHRRVGSVGLLKILGQALRRVRTRQGSKSGV